MQANTTYTCTHTHTHTHTHTYNCQEHGDQLCGSILMKGAFKRKPSFIFHPSRHFPGAELSEPWEAKVQMHLVESKIVRPERVKHLMELLRLQASFCPFPVKTVFDWLWWCNFSMKWQYVTVRMLNRRSDLTAERAARLVHFYRTDNFQRWALNPDIHNACKMPFHSTNRVPNGKWLWSNYKLLFKAHFFTTCPLLSDREKYRYFDRKEKEGSLQHRPSTAFAVTDAFNVISFGGFSVDPMALRSRYGDSLGRFIR